MMRTTFLTEFSGLLLLSLLNRNQVVEFLSLFFIERLPILAVFFKYVKLGACDQAFFFRLKYLSLLPKHFPRFSLTRVLTWNVLSPRFSGGLLRSNETVHYLFPKHFPRFSPITCFDWNGLSPRFSAEKLRNDETAHYSHNY